MFPEAARELRAMETGLVACQQSLDKFDAPPAPQVVRLLLSACIVLARRVAEMNAPARAPFFGGTDHPDWAQ
jgi:hypothetical protein